MGDLRSRLAALPKTELHLHLLGALRPATIVELARRQDASIQAEAERLAAGERPYADLAGFVAFFLGLFELARDAAAFERIAYEVLEDAAGQGVVWAELRITPTSHVARGVDEDAMFEGLAAGLRAAREDHGIHAGTTVDFPRGLPLEVGREAAAIAVRRRDHGVVAFDVAGNEAERAADEAFVPFFRTARAGGLALTAHAGEAAGPESVAGALDRFGVTRIGHGTRSVEDAALVARLAREGVVLEVCPTSNEALGVVTDVARHPLPAFLAAGVPCALSSDDPTLFGTDLLREHERVHAEAGVTLDQLAAMARTGLEAAFLPDGEAGEAAREAVARALDGVDAWVRDHAHTGRR